MIQFSSLVYMAWKYLQTSNSKIIYELNGKELFENLPIKPIRYQVEFILETIFQWGRISKSQFKEWYNLLNLLTKTLEKHDD